MRRWVPSGEKDTPLSSTVSSNSEQNVPAGTPWDTSVRLHGTVTAFKHRRGYGFVIAEGYTKRSTALLQERAAGKTKGSGETQEASTPPAPLSGSDFFFTRGALGGGFFVKEGDSVSFRVKTIQHDKSRSALATHRYVSRGGASSAPDRSSSVGEEEEEDGLSSANNVEEEERGGRKGNSYSAIGLRRYDVKTGVESRVLPVTISGVVTAWDAVKGVGVISELDMEGNLHPDAPKFSVTLDEMDLSPVANAPDSHISTGRYVKFCVFEDALDGEESLSERPRASRVIVDVGTERRLGKVGSTGPSRQRRSTSSHNAGTSPASTLLLASQRGVIREVVEQKYGFVVDDATGESIFFHVSEMEETDAGAVPRPGDSVVYDLYNVHSGRHAGKKHCLHVRLLTADGGAAPASGNTMEDSPPRGTTRRTPEKKEKKTLLDEFDLLD